MWPIGHVAGAYLCYTLYRWNEDSPPADAPVLILLFGSLFPDFVDKPLAWYVGILPTGRSLGHSLLFVLPLCILVLVLASRWKRPEWGIAFGIGALSHLLLDALPALWRSEANAGFLLYPIVPVEPYADESPSILSLLVDSLYDPYFHLEFVFLGLALIAWSRHGYPGSRKLRVSTDRTRRNDR